MVFIFSDFSVFPFFPYNKRVLLLFFLMWTFSVKLHTHRNLSCTLPRGLLPQTAVTQSSEGSPQEPKGKRAPRPHAGEKQHPLLRLHPRRQAGGGAVPGPGTPWAPREAPSSFELWPP